MFLSDIAPLFDLDCRLRFYLFIFHLSLQLDLLCCCEISDFSISPSSFWSRLRYHLRRSSYVLSQFESTFQRFPSSKPLICWGEIGWLWALVGVFATFSFLYFLGAASWPWRDVSPFAQSAGEPAPSYSHLIEFVSPGHRRSALALYVAGSVVEEMIQFCCSRPLGFVCSTIFDGFAGQELRFFGMLSLIFWHFWLYPGHFCLSLPCLRPKR